MAQHAWNTYVRVVGVAFAPVIKRVAETWTSDLVGFYVAWHLHGGFDGLEASGMHSSTIWRKLKRFRVAFGEHPDTFKMPGVTIEPELYWKAAAEKASAK